MNNPIISSFLNKFSIQNNLDTYDITAKFEHLCNFLVVYNEYNSMSFDFSDVHTGKATQGIDGIGIIVNGKFCTSVQEIKDLIDTTGYLDVKFILIQTKTSDKFSGEELGAFFTWSKKFFMEKGNLFSTDSMKNFVEMKEFIYANVDSMKRHTPYCKLYFLNTGIWNDDANLTSIIEDGKSELQNLSMFCEDIVDFYPCGSKEVQHLYRKSKEIVKTNIIFEKKVSLPKIDNVESAYSGVLPFSEFRKIILDENGNIKSVFDDNIRDYLETSNNIVNKDIDDTIKENRFEYFSILNNGITIVAEKVISAGDSFTLENYQIVNGCQTSHVLYENKDVKGINSLQIPVKIIETKDINIKSDITRATNNQTAVTKQELEALTNFQRTLEEFYIACYDTNGIELYYERRTNQYKQNDYSLHKIINIEHQVKAYSSMFLNLPHNASGHHGKLLQNLGDSIFNLNHESFPYYLSGLAYSILESLFLTHKINSKYKKYRFHILMISRYIITTSKLPDFTIKKQTDKYCKKILDVLLNEKKVLQLFIQSISILESDELSLDLKNRKTSELARNTNLIIDFLKQKLFIDKIEINLDIEKELVVDNEIKERNKQSTLLDFM
ncbi:AIPR family protein [Arcobacter sp. F2176]|uniref:AIPR family protein n=1 Tax=Arcobacter sp. F2176 TaxID=2044511 RepID=UPI00100A695B|nr:AIPR family protein [Arcobacter sp. F2176]RXJ79788.1 AIPR protein [Arcobacter sp. F2176]